MDYAKFAYLKATELEGNIGEQLITEVSSNNAIEFVEPILNMNVSTTSDLIVGKVNLHGKTFFQDKLIVKSTIAGKLNLEILINGVPILAEEREVVQGENQIMLLKIYTIAEPGEAEVTIRLKPALNFACTVISNTMAVWGAVSVLEKNVVEMRALKHNNMIWVSYCDNQKIMLAKTELSQKSLSPNIFVEVASGISHSFCEDKSGKVYLFRVDASGNLFYKPYGEVTSETKIDDNVSVCYAKVCPTEAEEDVLICYIKNGRPCFKNMTNGHVSSLKYFDVPAGKYINVTIANSNVNRMFVICTHSNLSNYIMYSSSSSTINSFTESLHAGLVTYVNRYVNFGNANSRNTINLSMSIDCAVSKTLLNYQDLLNNKITENLNAKFFTDSSIYKIDLVPPIDYCITYDMIKQALGKRPYYIYEGDCADWKPAKIDIVDCIFTDKSNIMGKWPFNEIKPCIVRNGKLIAYLNPNDYTKLEDGGDSDITNPLNHVMVQFPKFYYKMESDCDGKSRYQEINYIKIKFSNKKREGYTCAPFVKRGVEYDRIYVSAYRGKVENNQLLMYSGLETGSLMPHDDVIDLLPTIYNGQYTTFTINVLTLIQMLFFLMFANISNFGNTGLPDGIAYGFQKYTGVGNKKGMIFGSLGDTEELATNKMFGIENLVGGDMTFIDGFLYSSDYTMYVFDPYNPKCSLKHDSVEGYSVHPFTIYDLDPTNKHPKGQINGVNANSNVGILPYALNSIIDYGVYDEFDSFEYFKYIDTKDYPYSPVFLGNGGEENQAESMFQYRGIAQLYNPGVIPINERFVCYPDDYKSK